MKKYVIIILLLLLIIFIFLKFFSMDAHKPQNITFITKDGVEIVGNFYPQRGSMFRGAVLFLHMMPATKESWDSLARELQKQGVASLAIDLRGHGESTKLKVKSEKFKIKELDYRNFSDEEHQASKLDVEAGLEWLKVKSGGMPISIVGASIGANLALQALAEYNLPKVAALSPGLNYRGAQPLFAVRKLKDHQAVLYVSAKDDRDGRNTKETQELFDATTSKKQIKIYDKGGHGTDILEGTDLSMLLIDFLTK